MTPQRSTLGNGSGRRIHPALTSRSPPSAVTASARAVRVVVTFVLVANMPVWPRSIVVDTKMSLSVKAPAVAADAVPAGLLDGFLAKTGLDLGNRYH